MKIKKNDMVKIIAGKDKGKTGKVLRVHPTTNKIVVEGVHVLVKHVRSRRAGEQGQKVFFPGKFDASKALVICPKCGEATRVGAADSGVGRAKRDRQCKKCNQAFVS